MIILYDATIDCDTELRKVYEWAYGEFETDPATGERVLDDDRLPKPINPIKFPLQHCTVIYTGGRLVLSIPRHDNGPDFRIDELTKSAEPKRVSKGNKDIYTISGISGRLLRQNVDLDGSHVAFTVTKWRAEHLPNQKLAVLKDDE